MKEEALKLAVALDIESSQSQYGYVVDDWELFKDSANMIRRLVEELDKWEKDLHLQSHVLGFMEGKAAQAEEHMMLQQPLSDEEINQIAKDELIGWACDEDMLSFARAIEERHGIK